MTSRQPDPHPAGDRDHSRLAASTRRRAAKPTPRPTRIRAGRSVYFAPLADIIDRLAKSDREGGLRECIRYLCRAQLLIIDEIGYLALATAAGNLFSSWSTPATSAPP